ncbi:MAG: hypothetical protein ABSA75_15520 [Candidatus Bathyarchaeia archaeon]|jgi:DNA-binding PadR family transcriptional regulator
MTLRDDVLIILLENLKLRPSQIREELLKLPSYRTRDNRGLDSNLSPILKKLKDEGYVEIEEEKLAYRMFSITNKGKEEAHLLHMSKRMGQQPLKVVEVQLPNILKPKIDKRGVQSASDLKILKTFDRVQPKGEAKVEARFWLEEKDWPKSGNALDNFRKEIEEKMTPNIRMFATFLVENLKEANIIAKKARYQWNGTNNGPLEMQKVVEQERAGLDFDVMVLLHFDGRKVVTEIDWNKELSKFEEHDKLMREAWKQFKAAIAKPGLEQHNWLIDEMIENIRTIELNDLPSFLAKSLEASMPEMKEITENPWAILDSSEKLLKAIIERFTSKICLKLEHDENDSPVFTFSSDQQIMDSRAEVKRTLDEMLRDGLIEVVPLYLFKLNKEKANKAQWKAREGYPSPTTIASGNAFSSL